MSAAVHVGDFSGLSSLSQPVESALEAWEASDNTRRLWARDAELWTAKDEADWLGWLSIVREQLEGRDRFDAVADDVAAEGFTDILLLGMGGSSLCPEVLAMTFGKQEGYPELHVLDSTDPAQVKSFEDRIDLERTLFIVSSKSGSTLEPNIFKQYFFERVMERVGAAGTGRHFVAITDPGSKLEQVAQRDGFRHIFHGVPSIGGRYSALSNFGMVPAAAMGLDVGGLLARASDMSEACGGAVPATENPGVMLGVTLGTAAGRGRNKVTLFTSPGIWDLGAWLEQLLAESTGKEGVALIPVDREEIGPPEVYGDDRLFVYLRLSDGADADQDAGIERLKSAGQPVVRIDLADRYDIGREFFRWEFATAVAGSIMAINPFNQPDVEASKVATKSLTGAYEMTGSLPAETPIVDESNLQLFADLRYAKELVAAATDGTVTALVRAHLDKLTAGDYLGLLAYMEMNEVHTAHLQTIRHAVRDRARVATCLGFGPRFLHSTGQAYKGGPNTGVFLQITSEDAADLPVPGQKYTFGVVKAAQARGDFEVLEERGRRALRVHLGPDLSAGLKALRELVARALG